MTESNKKFIREFFSPYLEDYKHYDSSGEDIYIGDVIIEKIIENIRGKFLVSLYDSNSPSSFLHSAFIWKTSPEGAEFWEDVNRHLLKKEGTYVAPPQIIYDPETADFEYVKPFSAEDARILSAQAEALAKERIYELIKESASRGNYSVTVDIDYKSDMKKQLEEAGFSVKNLTHTRIKVSWN